MIIILQVTTSQNSQMHSLLLSALQSLVVGLVAAQPDPNSGCPPVARQQPSLIRPKDCPNPKTVPKSFGTIRDNECLIAGIVGVGDCAILIRLRIFSYFTG
jgi:hypothetical protein